MITREELQGKWTQLKGQIRERWGQLTEDEIQQYKGNSEALVGFIQQKTGTARREVEEFLTGAVREGEGMAKQAMDTVSDYANRASQQAQRYAGQATEAVKDQYDKAAQQLEAGYEEAREVVQARPMESIGVAFGAGLIAGTIIAMMLRPSRSSWS